MGGYADKMIARAELARATDLSAKEQQELLQAAATRYYRRIEQSFPRGYTIRQFIENLGRFCQAVTNRANAPIAPGVTGFGLTPVQLRDTRGLETEGVRLFRETLASAVAGNVLSVKKTKQGKAGSENLVFYMNRLLCVHFELPLNTGGWQRLPLETLIKMMRGTVAADDWGKKWDTQVLEFEETE